MRLDMRLLHFGNFIFSLENFIGFRKSFFDVADIDANMCSQILVGILVCEVDELRLIVDLDRVGVHGFAGI